MIGAYIIGLIISIATGIDSAVGQVAATDRNSKINQEATKIYTQISKDRDLLNRLYDAYTRRDNALASQMLMSSPFGSRISVLKQAYKQNQRDITRTNKKIGNLENEYQRVTGEINAKQARSQTTGSALIDWISGASKDPTTNPVEYKGTGTTERTIQEVNYGQK